MDYRLPGSSVHGISKARILQWVAISFSRGSSRCRDGTWVSCIAGAFFTIWATWETQSTRIGVEKGKGWKCLEIRQWKVCVWNWSWTEQWMKRECLAVSHRHVTGVGTGCRIRFWRLYCKTWMRQSSSSEGSCVRDSRGPSTEPRYSQREEWVWYKDTKWTLETDVSG